MKKKTLALVLCLLVCLCLAPAAHADSGELEPFAALKQAISNGETYFEMNNCGTVVFTESITIPSYIEVTYHGTTISLPKGVELTINSHLNGSRLVMQPGSHVTVSDNSQLTVNSALTYDSVSQFTIEGRLQVTNRSWTNGLRNLSLGPNAEVSVMTSVSSDDELAAAIATDYQFPNEQYVRRMSIRYDCTLKEDFDVRGFILQVDEGSLTVPEGVTLTVYDQMSLKGRPLYLEGTMINHGLFFVEQRDHEEPEFNVLMYRIGNGFYIGDKIVVHADVDKRDACLSGFDLSKFTIDVRPWATSYYLPIDLVLPGGLTRIEAEAFAGDSFRNVYIPENVTYIAPDAFKNVEPMYIICEEGSYAETFARNNGYIFVVYR